MTSLPDWMQAPGPIPIGISSCLLGEAVRYDGRHQRDAYIVGTLGAHFRFVPVCPEVAVGLGIPRPPIRLVADGTGPPRALGIRDAALDPSDALRAYGRRMAGELGDLSGYLFKEGSPSCGMERVKVYRPTGGAPALRGVGLYAAELMAARPALPCEEEGRLGDPGLREHFLERVYAYHRWRTLLAGGLTPGRLVEFHERHQLALLAHGAEPAQRLGRLVSGAGAARGKAALAALGAKYGLEFMAVLRRRATRRTHANVLQHLRGYLKRALDAADQAELGEAFSAYRQGQVPRVVPLTLLRHHFRRHPHPDVAGQTYLEPHPAELMLRSGV
jgi:uncharacterized protein YbgA (DUF1722 family)/uncharacterized protein YbbK (DUF523 family)